MKHLMLCLVAALALGGCAGRDRYVQWETEAPESFPKITAIGYAPLDSQPAKEQSQKVLLAMQASKIAAYRELAEQVYGQNISAGTSVNDWMVADDKVKASVSGVIRGARVVKSYPTGDHYVTELELDFALVWALYQQTHRPQKVKDVTYF
ncbi:LPP20 family lipoprotein [Shewanella cyperi]|uniref:LPP20 family lipoprotein n=1 Tax=Shewanella cyperi TaxID=2814292 RepID=A0A974XKM5_9GAMM|nr:LPP20 family lipoprotein [Shewanella cyperi]QSX28978.1 LPP20 family lipoprotein [Shewanella cyperi]QSX39710.1 LPP20 family lipoprotein [Shewanella cyperi]